MYVIICVKTLIFVAVSLVIPPIKIYRPLTRSLISNLGLSEKYGAGDDLANM
ncbi:LOW QUALITY PROTEIN: hypothetical protein PanWU01x14_012530 [Parasponia andersonii]|uniref:Uncharacterized protein n=1 Tax=Parasponia andersonii TaxID=3476 RepID=A0A2P5E1X7_PARAD|nr:LOW QUALITY PROTEIN: hypothetical protein PanWU01x14_012530 [Parasponia andersonii]